MCKSNFIHVCFIIDESGSMFDAIDDVIGGFRTTIDEQKAIKDGSCAVSFFKFSTGVEKVYIGKDINDVEYIDGVYAPHGLTALYDGVGTAIDEVGKWLNDMKEEERPEKNLIVIMTDGEENNSKEYTASGIKEMIKHQEEKYSWSFIYMGSDLKDANDANNIGIKTRGFASKSNFLQNWDIINCSVSSYRTTTGDASVKFAALDESLSLQTAEVTKKYAADNGLDATSLLGKDDK